ncbi:MAG: DUF1559 domain-containing protein, partial [Planctomycetaceae bacterium]|nr:DUF1559 domain-containing protein [Planctomycetaceae bacterium]
MSVFLGVKLHDYNPYMDGPQPERRLCGIDMVKVVERLGTMTLIASPATFFYVVIRLLCSAIPSAAKPKKMKSVELLVVFVIIGILVAILWPAVKAAKETGDRYGRHQNCGFNLKSMWIAMHAYHDKYGSLPPAYTVGADGKPLHSWRVLLLPFLETGDWHQQIRLDEPWD